MKCIPLFAADLRIRPGIFNVVLGPTLDCLRPIGPYSRSVAAAADEITKPLYRIIVKLKGNRT